MSQANPSRILRHLARGVAISVTREPLRDCETIPGVIRDGQAIAPNEVRSIACLYARGSARWAKRARTFSPTSQRLFYSSRLDPSYHAPRMAVCALDVTNDVKAKQIAIIH
jgi:hypothetical protein